MIFMMVGGALLICLGLLLGASWTTQALAHQFRRHAAERRELNEQWAAVRTARWQHCQCPPCGARLLEPGRPGVDA